MKTKKLIKQFSITVVALLVVAFFLIPKNQMIVHATFETDVNHKSSILVE